MRFIFAVLIFLLPILASAQTDFFNFTGFECRNGGNLQCHTNYPALGLGTANITGISPRTGDGILRTAAITTNVARMFFGEIDFQNGQIQVLSGSRALDGYYTTYVKFLNIPNADSEPVLGMERGGSFPCMVRVDSAGILSFWDDGVNADNLVQTGTTPITLGVWNKLDAHFVVGSAAPYEVRLNNVTELSGTANTGTTGFTTFAVGKLLNKNSETVEYHWDDLAMLTDGFPSNVEVQWMPPDADGFLTEWTFGVPPSNFSSVNERTPDGTDYIATDNVAGAKSNYVALQPALTSGITGTILSVKLYTRLQQPGSSSSTQVSIKSGPSFLTTTVPADVDIGDVYQRYLWLLTNTDPDTGSAWTIPGLDAAEVGVIENSAQTVQDIWLGAYVAFDSAATPTPTPTATATPTATFTPTATATPTVTPTATITPTFTPTATPTATGTFTSTPVPVVFPGGGLPSVGVGS